MCVWVTKRRLIVWDHVMVAWYWFLLTTLALLVWRLFQYYFRVYDDNNIDKQIENRTLSCCSGLVSVVASGGSALGAVGSSSGSRSYSVSSLPSICGTGRRPKFITRTLSYDSKRRKSTQIMQSIYKSAILTTSFIEAWNFRTSFMAIQNVVFFRFLD